MTEYRYQTSEAWNTAVKLASAVGRLKVASNLKAVPEAQAKSFEQAGLAAALIAEATERREGGAQLGLYRDAIGALAQCRSWLHIIADLVNEPVSLFAEELEMADKAGKQVLAAIRAAEMRGPAGPPGPRRGPPPGREQRPGPGPRPGGRP